ncbi:MAG: phosphatase PAP2 family protein [Variovorax sp.]|nr:MAG: phosphatase PAP2 family protein [Variovorax sp.]
MTGFWYGLTWFGDSGLLMPAALWIAAWLAIGRATRPVALVWVLLFGLGALAVLVSKLAFMGWGIGSATLNFTGFSGHTAFAASIWPVALWLAASRGGHRVRVAAATVGWVFAALIGYSRLAILAHSKSEVVAGLALGMAVSACFLWWQHSRPHPRLHWLMGVASLATPLLLLKPGAPAPTQGALEIIAVRLAGIERPFTREDLLRRRLSPSID